MIQLIERTTRVGNSRLAGTVEGAEEFVEVLNQSQADESDFLSARQRRRLEIQSRREEAPAKVLSMAERIASLHSTATLSISP